MPNIKYYNSINGEDDVRIKVDLDSGKSYAKDDLGSEWEIGQNSKILTDAILDRVEITQEEYDQMLWSRNDQKNLINNQKGSK